MRSKFFLLSLLCAASALAQKGVEDGSRYGKGQDSIKCLENISLYTEYVRTESYADAYDNWKAVFTDCPLAQVSTYTNGAKILRWMIANAKDDVSQGAYAEELMQVYDQRLKYLDQLNKIVKNPSSVADIKSAKAYDYITYTPKYDVNRAYDMLREAVDLGKDQTEYYILGNLMKISGQKFKQDENHRDDIIQDYLDCGNYLNSVIAGITDERVLEAARNTKENLDAYFINSGAADCESLQAIYGPKIEANKDSLEYLNKVVSIMKLLKCTSSEAYFQAAEFAHAISPSSQTAESLGLMYARVKKDNERALTYFEQAINLETDAFRKAQLYYTAAIFLVSHNQNTKAKTYLQNAISLNPNSGEPYIQLAQLYAGNHQWSNEPALNQTTFFLVIDKLQMAKKADPSLSAEADKLIKTYSEYTPKIEDLFMLNIKKGDKVEIKGWINESTIIR